jgi:hypothetical protein
MCRGAASKRQTSINYSYLIKYLNSGTPFAQQGSQGFWQPAQMLLLETPVARASSQSK